MTAVNEFLACDQCGPNVKAYVIFQMKAGPLAYCIHCSTVHHAALIKQGGFVKTDLTHTLGE